MAVFYLQNMPKHKRHCEDVTVPPCPPRHATLSSGSMASASSSHLLWHIKSCAEFPTRRIHHKGALALLAHRQVLPEEKMIDRILITQQWLCKTLRNNPSKLTPGAS